MSAFFSAVITTKLSTYSTAIKSTFYATIIPTFFTAIEFSDVEANCATKL